MREVNVPDGGSQQPRSRPAEDGDPFGIDCWEAVHELYHYLDGALTDERRLEITVHLDLCGPCSDAAVFEGELRHVIADRCRDRVPEGLRKRIAEAIDEECRRHGDPSISPSEDR